MSSKSKSDSKSDKNEAKPDEEAPVEAIPTEEEALRAARQSWSARHREDGCLVANVPDNMIARVVPLASSLSDARVKRYRAFFKKRGFHKATQDEIDEHGLYCTAHAEGEIWLAPAPVGDELRIQQLTRRAIWESSLTKVPWSDREARKWAVGQHFGDRAAAKARAEAQKLESEWVPTDGAKDSMFSR